MSCTARISGSLQGDGQANLNVTATLEPRMTALIRGFANAGGANANSPVLDGPAISASMSAAPGIASVMLRNRTPSSIEGPVSISRISDFLRHGTAAGFISFQQEGATAGRVTVNINRNSGPHILAMISEEISDYLSALMAPIATGEVLTKTEYLSLVTSVYNKGIADEISAATINASIDFPAQVRSVRGGTFSGRRANFEIPLLDLLVLQTPLSYEVTWR